MAKCKDQANTQCLCACLQLHWLCSCLVPESWPLSISWRIPPVEPSGGKDRPMHNVITLQLPAFRNMLCPGRLCFSIFVALLRMALARLHVRSLLMDSKPSYPTGVKIALRWHCVFKRENVNLAAFGRGRSSCSNPRKCKNALRTS